VIVLRGPAGKKPGYAKIFADDFPREPAVV
jgi:hypothetical protein